MIESIKKSMVNLTKLRGITLGAMFVAIYIVLGFFKIPITPDNRISITFIALVVSGFILGPIPTMIVGMLGDLIGFIIMPTGTYFPGYTLSAMLSGLVFGLCLYRKQFKHIFLWILLSRLIVTVVINLVLNTIWGSILYQNAINIIVWGRILKNIISFPVQVAISFAIIAFIEKSGIRKKYDI